MIEKARGSYYKPGRIEIKVEYIVLEYASLGELFCYISKEKPMSEDLARYVFKQILDGVEHIHKCGIVHRDLKIENILIDKDYNIKLTDFGFAGPLKGNGRNGMLTTKLGTPNYLAPEIIMKQPYYGEKTDIFACGVVLFVLVSFYFPFIKSATIKDCLYKLIATDKSDQFWQ